MVGYSQRIELEWLEYTAALVQAGHDRAALEADLNSMLSKHHSVGSTAVRSQRAKTVTVLVRTWLSVQPQNVQFRDAGLGLLATAQAKQHICFHWGMTMVSYPFFGLVAESAGRLLKLQGSSSADQIRRRIQEKLGARDQVDRSIRRVVRSFVDWGVLKDAAIRGSYLPAEPTVVQDRNVAVWLLEACIRATGVSSAPLQSLATSPMLFPFSMPRLTASDLSRNDRLDHQRTGLDIDTVTIRHNH